MSVSRPDAERHAARLQGFSRSGGPLGADTLYASVRNPAWFAATGARAARAGSCTAGYSSSGAKPSPTSPVTASRCCSAGPPGAGKSTAQNNLADTLGIALERWRVINSDDFKDLLLQTALADGSIEQLTPSELHDLEAQGARFWPRELAAIVHDEAGQLVSRATSETIASGENVIIDGTLSDPARARQLTDRLHHAGYIVRIASVDGPRTSSMTASATAGAPTTWRRRQASPKRPRRAGRALGPLRGGERLYERPDESRCATVARELAASHPAMIDHYKYRVERVDGAPQQTTHTGRSCAGAAQLSGEELATTRHPPCGVAVPVAALA